MGPDGNRADFRARLLDTFNMAPELCLHVDDLARFEEGSLQQQEERQRRILECLLELGWLVSHLPAYTGPMLDEVNLGILGAGDFFGELSLLPLRGGWRHSRTVTAASNSLLYTLSKQKVRSLEEVFPDFKTTLADHGEDYERVSLMFSQRQPFAGTQSVDANWWRAGSSGQTVAERCNRVCARRENESEEPQEWKLGTRAFDRCRWWRRWQAS